jgi:hypothetical protein
MDNDKAEIASEAPAAAAPAYEPLKVFVRDELSPMPEEISAALLGTTGPVAAAPPPDIGFGICAKVKIVPRDPFDDPDLDSERQFFEKLSPPIVTAAIAGPDCYQPEPRTFLGDETDPDDRKADALLETLRKQRREGIFFGTLGVTAPPTATSEQLHKSATATPATENVRASLAAFIRRQVADGSETVESLVAFAKAHDPERAALIQEVGEEIEKENT